MLHSHFYGPPKYLCKEVPFTDIEPDDGIDKICKTIYKQDTVTIVSNAYSYFQNLLSAKRGYNESFWSFECLLASAAAKIKSYSSQALPESLTAFILLTNSNIDVNKRISIFSASFSHIREAHRPIKVLWPLSDMIQLLRCYINVTQTGYIQLLHYTLTHQHFYDIG